MTILENWRTLAYGDGLDDKAREELWSNYFVVEKGIYEQILSAPETVVEGTVKELAEKYGTDVQTMTGFLDGINESLKGYENPIDTMDEDTVVKIEIDPEKLYYNMVEAKAEWLYGLPQWEQLVPEEKKKNDEYVKKLQVIVNRIGMSGEKGCDDIIKICQYLHANHKPISQVSIGQLCEILSAAPKNMEQRVRRAIAVGMANLAHMGIEDFMNETFTAYSGTLFPFEEIRAEMDHIRGKRKYGGKVSIKKFIDSLMLAADRESRF